MCHRHIFRAMIRKVFLVPTRPLNYHKNVRPRKPPGLNAGTKVVPESLSLVYSINWFQNSLLMHLARRAHSILQGLEWLNE